MTMQLGLTEPILRMPVYKHFMARKKLSISAGGDSKKLGRLTLRFTLRLIFDGRLGGNPLRREWLMNVRFAWRIRRIPF
jgi:hypothetical protein